MAEQYYNVWNITAKRWTNFHQQDPTNPQRYTLEEAQINCDYLNGCNIEDYEVRSLDGNQLKKSDPIKKYPNECPCGIKSDQCEYHK